MDPREGIGYALGWVSVATGLVGVVAYMLHRNVKTMDCHIWLGIVSIVAAMLHTQGMPGTGNSMACYLLACAVALAGIIYRYAGIGSRVLSVARATHVPLAILLGLCIVAHVITSFVY